MWVGLTFLSLTDYVYTKTNLHKKAKNKNYGNNVVHTLLCCARVKSAFVRGIDPQ